MDPIRNTPPPNALPGHEAGGVNPAPGGPPQPARAAAATSATPAAPASQSPAPLPKRYIRTLERDMEILKQGGTPDLAPLEKAAVPPAAPKPPPVKKPAPPPQSAVPPIIPPAPAFRPAQNFSEPPKQQGPPVVPVQQEAPPKPKPVPIPPPPPSPPPPRVAPLKTYSSDFTDRVRTTRASAATVLAAEQDAKRGSVRAAPAPKKRGILPVLGGVFFLVLGAGGALYAYLHYRAVTAPVVTEPFVTAPIFVNEQQTVAGTGEVLRTAMLQSLATPLTPGTVRELALATTTTNVFLALMLPAPGVLLRNISISPAVAGIVNVGSSPSIFFILPAASYSDTFAGMLQWEGTMVRDLESLFPPLREQDTLATTTASSTPARPAYAPGFFDEVVQNHDVRVYRDQRGLPRILYGYWNQRTLVITRDPTAFTEIMSRLANSRTR